MRLVFLLIGAVLGVLAPLLRNALAAQTTNTAPTVTSSSLTADTVARKTISNAYCDDHELAPSTQKVFWNGVDVTTSFPWVTNSAYYNCPVAASSKADLWANVGLNTLEARVCDVMNYSYSPSGPLCTSKVTYVRYRNVEVAPDMATAKKAPNRTLQYFDFKVRRIGNDGPDPSPKMGPGLS